MTQRDAQNAPPPLEPEVLRRRIDPAALGFATTTELEPLTQIIAQDRAVEAVRFGMGMRSHGFNLFVLGPSGLGKHTLVHQFLEKEARPAQRPADWCYVHNFEATDKPRALRLPPGRGAPLRDAMKRLAEEALAAITAVFESEEFRGRLEELAEQFNERERKAFQELADDAQKQGIALLRTPAGFALAPVQEGAVINPEQFEKLPEAEQRRIGETIDRLQEKLQKIIRQVPQWGRERRERLKELHKEFTTYAVGHLVDDVKADYTDLADVCTHLDAVRADIIDNAAQLRHAQEAPPEGGGEPQSDQRPAWMRRYQVNLLVDRTGKDGAPVVAADHPSYQNLVGRVEYLSHYGALVTDFMLIKPGALHEANGGYLLLDAHKLLTQPLAWDALKRALVAREIHLNSLGQMLGLVSTVSLEPQSIPLDVKVVLFGERQLYYLLYEFDPEFRELFKIAADFDETVALGPETISLYARLIATVASREGMLPFEAAACAHVLERAVRQAEDSHKLSTHMQSLTDLLRESDHLARGEGRATVDVDAVVRAIEAQKRRSDRVQRRMHEMILDGVQLIETSGERIGQVNGLTVLALADQPFGLPTRITATTRLGSGDVVDIHREVKLGGAIHSKGVLILSSFLAARYAARQPLSLSASLTFEQTYGMVDGDSASVAELCALLSSLAQVPIRQSLALTGAASQRGEVQAIGGVNEKIEGYFDVCNARGLTGEQGVLIPATNVRHLMLRADVVDAVRNGRFRVYAVRTVDEALTLLTGIEAGVADAAGVYPEGSVNRRVADALEALAALRRELGAASRPPAQSGGDQ